MMSSAPDTLLAYCRPGFEGDLASELTAHVAASGAASYCRAPAASAYVCCHIIDADATAIWQHLAWRELVFARQFALLLDQVTDLPANDRAGPIAERITQYRGTASTLWLEHPDTNEGKQLSRFCRRFGEPLRRTLEARGLHLDEPDAPRLHLFFTDSTAARIAISDPANSAPWRQGIPRLRMPKQAPSRSTLKLDEALQSFMNAAEREAWLRPGMRAVDLGAAPGGWSWQLAQRSIRVTAVDNAPMDESLLATGLVEHVAADGFRYRPSRPVDWLVCDIVEQPKRVVALVLAWLTNGYCGAVVANLKLPMKKRQATVSNALAELRTAPAAQNRRIGAKQLYHDREEITLFVGPSH